VWEKPWSSITIEASHRQMMVSISSPIKESRQHTPQLVEKRRLKTLDRLIQVGQLLRHQVRKHRSDMVLLNFKDRTALFQSMASCSIEFLKCFLVDPSFQSMHIET